MKKLITISIVCFSLCLIPASAFAEPFDISSSGVEITGPNQVEVHNVLFDEDYYTMMFESNKTGRNWSLTQYWLEEPTFDTSEYWPLDQGNTWTYQASTGEIETLAVNGTDIVCGVECIRLVDNAGGFLNWINDDTGLYITRFVFPNGFYNEWCPPVKVAPAQLYLGTKVLSPYTDAVLGVLGGPIVGTMNGWYTFATKGLEDVTVPAGTFTDCLRITMVHSFNNEMQGADGYRLEEVWYAKDLGIVQRTSTDVQFSGLFIFTDTTKVSQLVSSSLLP